MKKKDRNQGIWNNVYSDYYKYHIVLGGDDNNDNIESTSLRRGNNNHRTHHAIQALPATQFPNGREYFEKFTNEQRDGVAQVHANFVIGHDNKKSKLQEHGLWYAS